MYFCCVSGNNTGSFFFFCFPPPVTGAISSCWWSQNQEKSKRDFFPKPVVFVHKPNQTVSKSMSNPVSRINVSQVHFWNNTEKLCCKFTFV